MEDITLQTLSDLTYLNKYYLVHAFKNYKGVSPINYLINRRLVEAKHLLATTNYPISKIAASIGFSSQSYFSQFRKKTACRQMPTDKMKSYKKTPDNHNPVSFYHNLYLYLWLYTNKRVSSPTSPTSSITRPETEIFLCPIMIRARQTTNTIIIIMFLTALFISSTS